MNLPDGYFLKDKKYQITATIGQGGFGITYLGMWNTEVKGALGAMKTQIPICIKEYFFKDYCYRDKDSYSVKIHSKTGLELFDKFKEKLIKEANILSEVHHPHIVNVLEVFEENNTAYIVMEYITGCSLKYMLDCEGVLSENKVLKYVHQIGEALDFVHEKNIIHLDIKPSNIIIDKTDNARLIDFGVSKRYDIKQQDTSTTTLTLSKGFASIEQYDDEGTQSFSPCPDIYSLGATMYNLLTGVIPVESILRVTKDMLPPASYNFNISEKTEKTILKAMELKPVDRFQTIMEMLASLDVPPYEVSENLLVETANLSLEKVAEGSANNKSSSSEDDDEQTIVAFAPSSDTGLAKGKSKKNIKRKLLAAVAILLFALVGFAIYAYFSDDYLSKYTRVNRTLTKFENIRKPGERIKLKDKPIVTTIDLNEKNEGNMKIPDEKNNKGGDIISYSDEEKELKYNELMASAKANFQKQKYSEARADLDNALKMKITDEARSLYSECDDKLREIAISQRMEKYDILPGFGNLTIVKRKDTGLYGAINSMGEEKIPCKYKYTYNYPNGRAFQTIDNLYDIYDINGKCIAPELQSLN